MGEKVANPRFQNNEIVSYYYNQSSRSIENSGDEYLIGYEFEFFAKMNNKEVAKKLQKVLGKKIIVPYVKKGFGADEKIDHIVHSGEGVTMNLFKIEPDYSGGEGMKELKIGRAHV